MNGILNKIQFQYNKAQLQHLDNDICDDDVSTVACGMQQCENILKFNFSNLIRFAFFRVRPNGKLS